MGRFLLVLVLAAAFAVPASGQVFITFRTPSGNIGCYYSGPAPGQAAHLRCDIRSGLRPRPARPRGCVDLEWGDSYTLTVRGRTVVTCHGDTALDPNARVLRYGTKWSRGGFTCVSRTTGLRCRNRSRHGFFLSRGHSYRF